MVNGAEEFWHVALDYPIRPSPRWGYSRPPHHRLEMLMDRSKLTSRQTLEACRRNMDRFRSIAREYRDETEPYWSCGWLSPLDLMVLYSFVVEHRPARFVEVGSGCSTTFVHRAVRDHDLKTTIVSIDPYPRAMVDALCDTSLRQPLEEVDLALFSELVAGDMLFIDGSHRSFTNSDATVAVLEILPELAPGVVVGFDDIYLPYDYPPKWTDRFYSEQYLLAAWLLGGARVDVLFAAAWSSRDPELASVIDELLDDPLFTDLAIDGNGFWMRVQPVSRSGGSAS